MNRTVIVIASLALGSPFFSPAKADEPPKPAYKIVPTKDAKLITAIALNASGDLLCTRWTAENGDDNVQEQAPTLINADSGQSIRIPLLAGYTATFPAALSDTGVVAGRSSRPPVTDSGQRVPFSGVAFVWDEKSGIRSLGALPGDVTSHADGISSDGSLISGISIGPGRVRGCIWERTGEKWEPKPLPQVSNQMNSQKVVLSRNGKYAASVDGRVPTLWTRQGDGSWLREPMGAADALIPRAVNDNAVVVGLRFNTDAQSTRDAVVWKRESGFATVEKPKGYLYAELNAVNAAGVAVGFADGPHGSDIGPNACVTENGRLRIFADLPEFSSATAINDQNHVAGTFEEKEVHEDEGKLEPPLKGSSQIKP